MERVFQFSAGALAAVAAYFLWTGNRDGAFVSAVLGCVAFFLSVRTQAKARNAVRDAKREAAYESEAAAASPESTD
jgi:hypothetical protein